MSDVDGPDPEPTEEELSRMMTHAAATQQGPMDDDDDDVNVVRWRDLDSRKDTDRGPEAVWTDLGEWVEWLIYRYGILPSLVPDCWYRHGGLVEELSALYACWVVAFSDEDSGYGPIGFHERLAAAQGRFAMRYDKGCAEGHQDPAVRRPPTEATVEHFEEWSMRAHATPEARPQPAV